MSERAAKRRRLPPEHDVSDGIDDSGSLSAASNVGSVDEGASIDSSNDDDNDDNDDDESLPDTNGDAATAAVATGSAKPQRTSKKYQAVDMTSAQVFKMQATAMLQQVVARELPDPAPATNLLRSLKAAIEQMAPREPLPVPQAERLMIKTHKIAVPFPVRPPNDTRYKLGFAKAANVNVVGSYPLKMATAGSFTIDMLVTMPEDLFTEKDYLDYRYFHKRAYYLACLAAGLRDALPGLQLQFDHFHDNHLLPVLLIEPPPSQAPNHSNTASTYQVCVLVAPPASLFPASKTSPDRCCVRLNKDEDPLSSTPFYNGTLRADVSVASFLKLLHQTSSKCPSFRDACILGRVWLRQRGLSSSLSGGGFGNFEWAAMLALLLSPDATGNSILLPTLDAVQLFRAAMQFLARRDLVKQPLVLQATLEAPRSTQPYLFDGIRGLNILFKMTSWSYKLLCHEARTSLQLLSNATQEQFDATFIYKVNERGLRHDLTVQFPWHLLIAAHSSPKERRAKLEKMHQILRRGLTDRANLIDIAMPSSSPWPIKADPKSTTASKDLTISLSIDTKKAARSVERGPSADEADLVADFKDLWAGKAELRRFKDGSIICSTVWSEQGPLQITSEIVSWLLKVHFGIDLSSQGKVSYSRSELVLHQGDVAYKAAADKVMSAYRDLEKTLRSLKGMPLEIRSVLPADPSFSNTSLSTYLDSNNDMVQRAPASVVIQFEASAKWPDDLRAINVTKAAFLLKLSDLLKTDIDGLSAQIVLENADSETLNAATLEIKYPSGVWFALRIHNEREQSLVEKQLKERSSSPRAREAAADALSAYKRNFIRLPRHVQAMTKAVSRHEALSTSTRLLKRWFAAHLLSQHFSDQAMELFAARAYLHPQPWTSPSIGEVGFLRTLVYLSRWDWRNEPWTVDFGSAMTSTDYAGLRTRFSAWRHVDPSMSHVSIILFADHDDDGSTWTEYRPSPVVINRLIALARAAVQHWSSLTSDDPSGLFDYSLKDFDFDIQLAPAFSRRRNKKKSKFKNLQLAPALADISTSDPVASVAQFVAEVERAYGNALVLFWAGTGEGDRIAGVWKPHTQQRRWKVNLEWSSLPMQGTDGEPGLVRLNKHAVLAEIARLGGDMVEQITAK